MALNKRTLRDRRRQFLAREMVRRPRVTQRQLRRALTEAGHVNPETQKPWSLGTVNNDVEAIREAARERMEQSAETWRANELDLLARVQERALEEGELRTVVMISRRRAALLGLDEPDELRATVGPDPETVEALMDALRDYPDAREAAARALDE